ncbi:MAG: phage major capsid protein [Pirellulaceae bacterium]
MSAEALADYQAQPVHFAADTDGIKRGMYISNLLKTYETRPAAETMRLMRSQATGLTMCELFQGRHRLSHDTVPEPAIAVRHGLSSVDGIAAMTALFNVSIQAGTEAEVDSTEGWTRIVDIPNFKDANILVHDTVPRPSRLGRGDVAPHCSMSLTSDTWKLSRYATQFVLDDQDRIDTEHFGLWLDALELIGRSFARLKADLVYSVLLDSSTTTPDGTVVFHADHSNLEAGAMGSTSLQKCRSNIAGKVAYDDSGRPSHCNLDPRYVLCPPEIADNARVVARSIIDRNTSAIVRGGGDIIVRSESRLSAAGVWDPVNLVLRTGSTSNFLVAAPASQLPCVLVGGLGGKVAPTVSQFKLAEGQWGMGVSVHLDLGVTVADYRGLCWSTGLGG